MRYEKEYCCTGLKCLGLVPGEEVRIMEGVKLEVEPERVIVIREYPSYVPFSAGLAEFRVSPHPGSVSYPHTAEKHIVFAGDQCLSEIRHVKKDSVKNTAVIPERTFRHGTSAREWPQLHFDESAARQTVLLSAGIHGAHQMTSVLISYRIIRQQVAYCLNTCC